MNKIIHKNTSSTEEKFFYMCCGYMTNVFVL